MKFEEAENCKFEPTVGSLAGNKEKPPVPGDFFERMGTNFQRSNPKLYKQGKLKMAKIHLRNGKDDDAFKVLAESFDLHKAFQHFMATEFRTWKEGKRAMLELSGKAPKKPQKPVVIKPDAAKKQDASSVSMALGPSQKLSSDQLKDLKDTFNMYKDEKE